MMLIKTSQIFHRYSLKNILEDFFHWFFNQDGAILSWKKQHSKTNRPIPLSTKSDVNIWKG